jgi:membrane protease YdiL (CAAX protease family)
VAEWALLRFVLVGVKRTGVRLRDLVSGRWSNWKDVVRDLVIGLAFWLVWSLAEASVERFLGPDSAKGIGTLLPQGPLEITIWVALSLTAGFCEEAVFRGYLQRQLRALSGSVVVGILGQAAIFGISHGYQGGRLAITIAIYGLAYGVLAQSRQSLRPGILAHAWSDVFSGILARQR